MHASIQCVLQDLERPLQHHQLLLPVAAAGFDALCTGCNQGTIQLQANQKTPAHANKCHHQRQEAKADVSFKLPSSQTAMATTSFATTSDGLATGPLDRGTRARAAQVPGQNQMPGCRSSATHRQCKCYGVVTCNHQHHTLKRCYRGNHNTMVP